ncbi:MAG TPA: phosphoglucosamine mutase [Clostridiales bacterium]|nr:phosphoglucosamine mutase [Clostridiales bacterium]
MKKLFGTDGIRGVANLELTGHLAFEIGKVTTYVLAEQSIHSPVILIGRDTRISGDLLESSLVAGICAMGGHALCLGVIPTPGIAYLTQLYQADAGIVISASHNSFEFNGIKIFNSKGYKLSDELEEKIEKMIVNRELDSIRPIGDKIGRKSDITTSGQDYADFLQNTVETDFTGMKLVMDCANGAAYKIAPALFQKLGATVDVIAGNPTGININNHCGATDLENLIKAVKGDGYDMGIAFDGDADRFMAVDKNGGVVNGDMVLAILGLYMKSNHSLIDNTIVATVMSNLGLFKMAEKNGLNIVKTKVGDRYVLAEMLDKGYVLGGEQSGHTILLQHSTTGDGLLTSMHLLEIMKNTKQPLSELSKVMTVFPQVLLNAKVSEENKDRYLEDPIIQKMCSQLEEDFKGDGRVLIRPSGTEPLVRVMIEGQDKKYITDRAMELVKVIEGRLN